MTALLTHPHHVKAAAGRLIQQITGAAVYHHSFRLTTDGLPGEPGHLAEVRYPDLFGDGLALTAFLCFDPSRREPHAFDLNVFTRDQFCFRLGRCGVVIRPSFGNPDSLDVDPFHRVNVPVPAAQGDESGEPARGAFLSVFTTLIQFAVRALTSRPSIEPAARVRTLLRLYQTRAMLYPRLQSLPAGAPSHSPVAFQLPYLLNDARLGGWRDLPVNPANELFRWLLPIDGTTPEMPATAEEFHRAVGWEGSAGFTSNTTLSGSWLWTQRTPTVISFDEIASVSAVQIDMINSAREILTGRMLDSMGIPAEVMNGHVSSALSGASGDASMPRSNRNDNLYPNAATQMRDELYLRMGVMSARSQLSPEMSDEEVTAPPPAPATPQTVDLLIADVPETMFDVLVEALTAALAGRAEALPGLTLDVESDTGRYRVVKPTPPVPTPPPPDAIGERGIYLD